MDPITAAVLAALPALAVQGVRDAYDGLKAAIRRKWGADAPISKAIDSLESDPKSKAQAAVLEEKVGATKAIDDVEVAKALQTLLDTLKQQGIGGKQISRIAVTITGGKVGVAGAENLTIETFNMGN
jgi:hypothetical protein